MTVTYLPSTERIHDTHTRENFEYIESHAVFKDQPVAVTGSRGGNVALASLLAALVAQGIIIDNSSP